MNIFILHDDIETGPFSWVQVFIMLRKGELAPESVARIDGFEEAQSIEEWGLWREGDEVGPFSWDEISDMLKAGVLDLETLARFESDPELKKLQNVIDQSQEIWLVSDNQKRQRGVEAFKQVVRRALTKIRIPEIGLPVATGLAVVLIGGLACIFWPKGAQSTKAHQVEERVNLTQKNIGVEKSSSSVSQKTERESWTDPDTTKTVERTSAAKAEEKPSAAAADLNAAADELTKNDKAQQILSEQSSSAKADDSQKMTVPSSPLSAQDPQPEKPIISESTMAVPSQGNSSPHLSRDTLRIEKIHPFETPQLTASELEDLLQERFSSVAIKIPDSYDERPGKGLLIYEGSFTLETKLVHNPKVEIVYRVPLVSKNRPGPDADNIVMVGIYHGAIQPRIKKILDGKEVSEKSPLHGALKPFADQLGYSAFTMHIATTPEMASDHREYYAYGGPDWVDLVYRAKAEIEKRHKLKQRKLLLFGTSEGGQFVQNIAAAAPEKVAAVSTQSGPNITPPNTASETAWFLAITRGDSMQTAYEGVYNRLLEQNASVIFNIFQPSYKFRGLSANFYHSQSAIATLASRSFLRGVVDHYDSKNSIDRTKWPYVRDRTRPLRIYQSGADQAKAIPEGNREYLPSRAFAQCLQAVPAPMQSVTLISNGVPAVKAFVAVPPLGKPKGTIVYAEAFNIRDLPHMFDNIYYLAAMGYVVVAPQMRKSDSHDILSAAEFAANSKVLGKYPMAMVGYGPKANLAWDVVARNREIAPKAVAMLEFTPCDSFDESKLPPGRRMDAPIVFVYDEHPLTDVTTSDEAKKSIEIVSAVREFVAKCNERKQLAKVVIVPKPEQAKNTGQVALEQADKLEHVRVAQISLEAAERFITKVIENKRSEIGP